MRRGVVLVSIFLIAAGMLATSSGPACPAAPAQGASVTVSATVARTIHVSGTDSGRGNVNTVRMENPGSITFVAP